MKTEMTFSGSGSSPAGEGDPDRIRVLLLQHATVDLLFDAYEERLFARGTEVTRVRPPSGEPLPDWRAFDGIVVMGGSMSAFDDADHPWLAAERTLIRESVEGGMPYWGVCLGSQLLAASLGAEVRRAPVPEIGVKEIRLRPAGRRSPLFAGAPPTFHSLEWHQDTFALPNGATSLADSDMYANQAYAWRQAYAVQFHLEPSLDLLREWISRTGYDDSSSSVPDVAELEGELRRIEHEATALARRLIDNWLDLVVIPARA
jgi:GMP synthase (glutamine-hydrolysing)